MTATHTRYIPVPVLNVDAETPLSLQGDTADRPRPAPKAIRRRDNAAAPTAPAAIAPHDTADCASTMDAARRSVSILYSPGGTQRSRPIIRHNQESSTALEAPLAGPFLTTSAERLGGFRFLIDRDLRNPRQRRIGLFFFVERLIEQPHGVVQAKLLRPGLQGAVSRNFIMLDCLRRCQQTGVERRGALVLLHDLGALFGDADNGVAGLGLRLFVYRAENLFQPRDMAFRLASVLFESLFQIGRLRGFRHFRQCRKDLLFREIYVFQRIMKKIFEVFRLFRHGGLLLLSTVH